MKCILVCSVFDAFDYVMNHYYPVGMEELSERNDCYAVISIQDTHTKGFGLKFCESEYCKAVLTLYFDDIVKEVDDAVLFDDGMAKSILDFVEKNENVETILVHCYAGMSRSKAVGKYLYDKYKKVYPSLIFNADTSEPNEYVYDMLKNVALLK